MHEHTWNLKHIQTQFLLHYCILQLPWGLSRAPKRLVLCQPWDTGVGGVVNKSTSDHWKWLANRFDVCWNVASPRIEPFWIDLMWKGASSSYGQTCDGARLLTWGNSSVRQCCQCNLMQVFGLVLKHCWTFIVVFVWKSSHGRTCAEWLQSEISTNTSVMQINMKSVAHHELHAQGTKHFGLWYDVSTFTFLHSGSGTYFENETLPQNCRCEKKHAGSIRCCWNHMLIHIVSSDYHFKIQFPNENQ